MLLGIVYPIDQSAFCLLEEVVTISECCSFPSVTENSLCQGESKRKLLAAVDF